MKKKKWMAMLLAAMMAFGFVGCGGGDDGGDAPVEKPVEAAAQEEITFVGDWDCVGYDADGQEMTEEECGESFLTINDNFTVNARIMDQNYKGEWDYTESGVVLYLYDGGYEEEVYCDMVDDVMYMDYMNMYTLFRKAE
ncbi:MAG: hypothetical protein Q4C06_06995 [Bacillota bacterium]|nr:hypothetical protein [Bacillota bacterium]